MSALNEWALAWNVPMAALHDLARRLGELDEIPPAVPGRSEAAVQASVRVEASQKGMRLFRNNVGALKDARGVPVRYGLANDSAALNARIKSGDLIGWETVTITPEMVGQHIARFLSVECKEEGWQFTGTPREEAQQAWAHLVLAAGGRALFVSRSGML